MKFKKVLNELAELEFLDNIYQEYEKKGGKLNRTQFYKIYSAIVRRGKEFHWGHILAKEKEFKKQKKSKDEFVEYYIQQIV